MFEEPINLFDTDIVDEFNPTKNFKINYSATYRFEIIVTVSTNVQTQDYTLLVGCTNAKNMDELLTNFSKYINERGKQIRNNTSGFNYFLMLLKEQKEYAVLIYPELKLIAEVDGSQFYFGESTKDKIKIADYDPVIWKFLF